jgi:tetratricopeptide (TPR) repeat protein
MTLRISLIFFFFFLNTVASAASIDWQAGGAAFLRGDYVVALTHFEKARQDGLTGPAVNYNIAVCQFKLSQYQESAITFRRISRQYPKMRGLAEYNLGLIARRTGDSPTAIEHFVNAHRLSADNREIRVLASRRLRELEPEIHLASPWTGAIGGRTGFDDNVALRDESAFLSVTKTDSPFLELFASVKGPYNGGDGIRVDARVYLAKYFDTSDFDQSEVYLNALYDWRPGKWRLQGGAHFSTGTLGGDQFDRKTGGNFLATRYLNSSTTISFSYIYDDIKEEDIRFAGIAGSRQILMSRLYWNSDKGRRFILRYHHESNDRLDANVSPNRVSLSADYRYQPDVGWGFELGASYRVSRFEELLIQREENLGSAHIGITRRILDDWQLLLDYRYSQNDASDSLFSYKRNVISVGAVRAF